MTPGPFLAVYCVFNHLIFLDPRPTEGPIKSPLSVSLSVCPPVSSAFFSEMAHYFFMIIGTMVDNWNI